MKYNFKIIEGAESVQGSPEWKAFRSGKIGASHAATILNIDPWKTPLQLWEEIVFDKEVPVTSAMQRGKDLESVARDWINQKLGKKYQPVVIQSLEHPSLIASLDGFYFNDKGKPHLLEIKCPSTTTHEKALQGVIPPHYYAQMQHQMMICGVEEMLYLSFDGYEGKAVLCAKDPDFCLDLLSKELAFISSVIDFKAPEPCDKDWVEINDPESNADALEYQSVCKRIDDLDMEKERLRQLLIQKCSHARTKIGALRVQKVQNLGRIDYAALVKDKSLETEAEKFRKAPTDMWRITFSEVP